jgi:peptidoglycan/LPS O-acetylase OafA/YrhL
MNATEVLIAVLALVATVALTGGAIAMFPRLGDLVLGHAQSRVGSLDGLRGILALSVLAHHSLLTKADANHENWIDNATRFGNQMGSCAVALFFMVSAYLFCGALVRNRGAVDLGRLAQGRLLRIVPLYMACVATLVLFVAISSHFTFAEPPLAVAKKIGRYMLFGFVERYPINGLNDSPSLLGQVWTLKFEWLLYLSLPVLGWAARRTNSIIPIYVGLIACTFIWPLFAFFVTGCASSQLVRFNGPRARIAWQVAGVVGLLAVMFALRWSGGWRAALLLTPFFVALLQARGIFAALGARSLRYLGEISYSVYLIHGFVIWAGTRWILTLPTFVALGPVGLFLSILGFALATVALATLTFRFIERPFIERNRDHPARPRRSS